MQDTTEVRQIELTSEDAEIIDRGEIVWHKWPDGETSGIIHAKRSDDLQPIDMPSDFMAELTESELSELAYGKVLVSEGGSGHIYTVSAESTPKPDAEQVAAKWDQSPEDKSYGMIRFEQL